jgi:lipopolysaccharide heptosyltransferase II
MEGVAPPERFAWLFKQGQYVVYLCYRIVEFLLSFLPMGGVSRVGRLCGALAYLGLGGYRRLARRNLEYAFGVRMSPAELDRMTKEHFRTLGANLLCGTKLSTLNEEQILECIDFEGLDILEAALEEGNGCILALAHMGIWEAFAQVSVLDFGRGAAALFQRLGNPYLSAHIVRQRERFGTRLFDRRDGFSGPIAHLRSGGGIGVLIDQHAGDSGQWSPFFGKLASTSGLAALLSRRTGAPVLSAGMKTVGPGKWLATISRGYEAPNSKGQADQVTCGLSVALEEHINESPADWFWVHDRWKIPTPQFLLTNYKKGVVLPWDATIGQVQRFEMLVRSPNWLGDACMAIPAVRAMRRGRPDARLTVLTPEKLADIWRAVPEVDDLVIRSGSDSNTAVTRRIREHPTQFDVAILLPNSARAALEVRGAGIPRVVGYRGDWRRRYLDQIIAPRREPGPVEHHVRHFMRMAFRLGADVKDPDLFTPLEESEPEPVDGQLRLAMCPGAEYGSAKRWPAERFAEAAREIQKVTGCRWVIVGVAAEAELGAQIESAIGGECDNLVGKTSLTDLIAELRKCHALLTNDTGTMHLAAIFGVSTVSLFGSTEPAWTGPMGRRHSIVRQHVECSPCFLRECPIDFRCMLELDVDRVVRAVLQRVAQHRARLLGLVEG